jgi:hypothetical protein
MRVFESRTRRIFGPTWEEVTGRWKKLHNEELHASIKVLKDEMGMACSMHGR